MDSVDRPTKTTESHDFAECVIVSVTLLRRTEGVLCQDCCDWTDFEVTCRTRPNVVVLAVWCPKDVAVSPAKRCSAQESVLRIE
jgi:hypothetical protein